MLFTQRQEAKKKICLYILSLCLAVLLSVVTLFCARSFVLILFLKNFVRGQDPTRGCSSGEASGESHPC